MLAHGEHNPFGSVAALVYQPGGLPGHLVAVLSVDAHSSPPSFRGDLMSPVPAAAHPRQAGSISLPGQLGKSESLAVPTGRHHYQRGWWFWQGLVAVV